MNEEIQQTAINEEIQKSKKNDIRQKAKDLGFIATEAYVPGPTSADADAKAAKRKSNAERQARHREKNEAKRLAASVPDEIASQVTDCGGWPQWLAAQNPAPVLPPVTIAREPSAAEIEAWRNQGRIEAYNHILSLAGIRGWLVRQLVRLDD